MWALRVKTGFVRVLCDLFCHLVALRAIYVETPWFQEEDFFFTLCSLGRVESVSLLLYQLEKRHHS